MTAKRIHLIFKTHLDIGFTDHAEVVRRQYHERFIPQALATAEHCHREDPDHPRFIWTTGAWLIWDHLELADAAGRARLERAIARGLIRWHALPFTTHSELMSPALFRAGLSYAADLDRRFGVRTIAAKMTDVPGHTRGIVPLLAEAGVKFLHIGVNTASPMPDVPEIFRWRAPGGAEVLVMYQHAYGATHCPAGFDDALGFAHTSDNLGPQTPAQTSDVYRHLAAENPGAEIRAASLDDYAALLWPSRAEFPVVDVEIGDSWIHGVASDPQKTARFLALQRLYDGFAEAPTPERQAFGRRLALVAEHTWGVDIKSFLRDEVAWDRSDFAVARATDHRFAYSEQSWAEQRAYLDAAVATLGDADRNAAEALAAPPVVPSVAGKDVSAAGPIRLGDWMVSVDPTTGDIRRLVAPGGAGLDGGDGPLIFYRHETYDAADVAAQMDSYIQHRADWAILDHDKPGLANALTARSAVWTPRLGRVARDGARLGITATLADTAVAALGAPTSVETILAPAADGALDVILVLRAKAANRMPEAGFLGFAPAGIGPWDFLKMGLWQPSARVAPNGGGALQAIAAARGPLMGGGTLQVEPRDTPLVAPTDAPFMRFSAAPPSYGAGLRFNLYNNKWGTNFPMWWSGDLVARFRLSLNS